MPFSGLVITLCDEDSGRDTALAALAGQPDIELGPRDGRRLAAVLDAEDDRHGKRRCDELRRLDGVVHLDVVFIELEAPVPVGATPPTAAVPDPRSIPDPNSGTAVSAKTAVTAGTKRPARGEP